MRSSVRGRGLFRSTAPEGLIEHADPKTLLFPDLIGPRARRRRAPSRASKRPHNSAADLYPYLILTAHLTDPRTFRMARWKRPALCLPETQAQAESSAWRYSGDHCY